MAKPNYSFEKRQRELAKKKKKDEKLARKQEARDEARPGDAPAPDDTKSRRNRRQPSRGRTVSTRPMKAWKSSMYLRRKSSVDAFDTLPSSEMRSSVNWM